MIELNSGLIFVLG